MIRFPSAHHDKFCLPPRAKPTPLNQERSFLLRIVGHSEKKLVPQETDSSSHPRNRLAT